MDQPSLALEKMVNPFVIDLCVQSIAKQRSQPSIAIRRLLLYQKLHLGFQFWRVRPQPRPFHLHLGKAGPTDVIKIVDFSFEIRKCISVCYAPTLMSKSPALAGP
jgi:hypothetical protein